jgi:hypothetical protein
MPFRPASMSSRSSVWINSTACSGASASGGCCPGAAALSPICRAPRRGDGGRGVPGGLAGVRLLAQAGAGGLIPLASGAKGASASLAGGGLRGPAAGRGPTPASLRAGAESRLSQGGMCISLHATRRLRTSTAQRHPPSLPDDNMSRMRGRLERHNPSLSHRPRRPPSPPAPGEQDMAHLPVEPAHAEHPKDHLVSFLAGAPLAFWAPLPTSSRR